MKKLFTFIAVLLIAASLMGQAPSSFKYQAVLRDARGNIKANIATIIIIDILQGNATGTSVYSEMHTVTTDGFGLINLEIGNGIATNGTLTAINWGAGTYYVKVTVDGVVMGTGQLLSVPYALHAKTAEMITGGISEADPIFIAWNKSTGISITASQVIDFQTKVTNNAAVLANTAKNSYPSADAAKLAAIKGINTGDQDLSGKVDKVTGKGLSTNDYTSAEKTKLAAITGDQDLSGKVDKVTGKGLSTNDYTAAEQTKLAGIATGAEVNVNADWSAVSGDAQILNKPTITGTNTGDQDLSGKVDKVTGKGLSTNDYTTAEQTKVSNLSGTNTGDQTLSGLGGIAGNTAITGATKTKITYDVKGLVTAGTDATTADIAASTNKNYVTDAQQTVIGNTSGTNSGDNATNTQYSGLETNATHTGEVSGTTSLTIDNAAVIGKVLTGYASGAGTVTATDNILQAIQKLDGNAATNANLTGMVTSVGNATTVVTNANLTGDVTSSGNATTIANNAVTDSKFRQGAARSIVGVTGNATANTADIQGTADQILRVNGAGNVLAFGSIDLSKSATVGSTVLPVANGGMGADVTPAGAGEVLYSSSTTAYGHLGAGTSGQVLTSGGAGVPTWQSTGATAWSLLGNTETIDVTNFIGTTDNVPFNVRVNSQKAGRIDNTLANTFWGYQAGNSNNTGNGNTANGQQALNSNVAGSNNTANGYQALYKNISGSYNTANGTLALYSNVAGSKATAIGHNAMRYSNSSTGADFDNLNVAVGFEALRGSTDASANTGNSNTAIGYQTLWSNTSGEKNTANGVQALYLNTSGNYNTANGVYALYTNTTGHSNTANGVQALNFNTSGNYNTANGANALYLNTTGISNTANGYQALSSNTDGSNNTALGYGANVGSSSLTNATAIGNGATVDASNRVQIGNSSVTDVYFGNGTTTLLHGVLVREVADEFTPSASQTGFSLNYTPSANSKVKMYINGVRISNTAYTFSSSSTALTYIPANNGAYALLITDRVQFDYFY